ncbi:MAG: histidine--tRNA ligase [Candidatus Jorgensenbacteria bacterium]|nr:histidine--tRNA ligase [Candidatus Jorgensenbacteria bacterium]
MTTKIPPKKKVKKAGKANLEALGVKGMSDILPKDGELWKLIMETGRHLSELYDFHFIETPTLESPEIFLAGLGEKAEEAAKKMYSFKTPEGEDVALRQDLSAPVLRSYIEHHLGYFASPLKVYHTGSVFRFGKLDNGNNREIRQWGFDIIGDNDAVYDMQVILASLEFLKQLKFPNLRLKINTMGCRVCRNNYHEKLKAYFRKQKVCGTCKVNVEERPLRLFKCVEAECIEVRKEAPIILDHLCQACNNHFKAVLELVEDNGVLYEPDPYFVREKEYYSRTVFEIYSGDYEHSLAGGGRYDYLSEMLFKKIIPGVGSALSLDRILEQVKLRNTMPRARNNNRVFFIAVGEQAKKMSVRFMNTLRMNNIAVVEALGKKTLTAQMKFGERVHAPLALIFGQKEAFENSVIVRDTKSGAQETVILEKLVEEVKKRLR